MTEREYEIVRLMQEQIDAMMRKLEGDFESALKDENGKLPGDDGYIQPKLKGLALMCERRPDASP